MRRQQQVEIPITDFSGGRASAKAPGSLAGNEMAALDSIVLLPGQSGFYSMPGNTRLNSSPMAGGGAGQGITYWVSSAGTKYLVTVFGGQISYSTDLGSTFLDATQSNTITAGQDNLWTFSKMNDLLVGVGGAPNAPWKLNASLAASNLGGSPPTGNFGFVANNRMFIGSGSTIYWSVLANCEDWSGTGSGNAGFDVDDGHPLVAGGSINHNQRFVWKKNKTWLLAGETAPFAPFLLFPNIGCVGKKAWVNSQGLMYWINADAEMCISDGNTLINRVDLPQLSYADDLWDSFQTARLPYIQGVEHKGKDFHWIVWSVTKDGNGRNDYAIIWDVEHKCWLNASHGFEANGFASTEDGALYMAGYDGFVYKCLDTTVNTLASYNSSNVSWFVESDWLHPNNSLMDVSQVHQANISYKQSKATANMTFRWAKDYSGFTGSSTFSIKATGDTYGSGRFGTARWAKLSDAIANVHVTARGNVMKFRIQGSDATTYRINRMTLVGKQRAQKRFTAA